MFTRSILCLLIGLLPLLAEAQSDLLPALINAYPTAQAKEITSALDQFTSQLRQKKNRPDKKFLSRVVRESHRNFFHTYQPYAQFSEIFEKGNYDCLSATSFLSVVFERLNFKFRIIETNYHIFLMVETNEGLVLVESTDKLNGVVADAKQIEQRISTYQSNRLLANALEPEKRHYEFKLNLYQSVRPDQLPGLLYFNQAVIAYNNSNLIDCAAKLEKARKIYESPRTSEFAVILVKSVVASNLPEETKKDLIRPFVKYLKSYTSVIASR